MRRALLVLLVLLAASCVGLRVVPEDQAASDLVCPASQVHITVGFRTQIASGCGRSLAYTQVCSDDRKHCHFEAMKSRMEEMR